MAETMDRAQSALPTQRSASVPVTPPVGSDDWSRLTPERRRQSELEQLQIDIAAGR